MDDPVRRALADLADADASRHAPPHLERAVLDTFDRERERGRLQRYAAVARSYRREVVAVVVAAAVASTIYVRLTPPSVSSRSEPPPLVERLDAQELVFAFPPSVRQHAPAARAPEPRPARAQVAEMRPTWRTIDDIVHSVRVRVPRTILPMLGVPIIEPDAAGMVNIEMLLGDDGLARSIRIVP